MRARGENIGADFLPSWDWVKVDQDKKDKVEADHYRRFGLVHLSLFQALV